MSEYKAPASGVIEALGSAIRYSSIDEVPELVVKVVSEDMWREFTTKMGKHVTHDTFESFVTTEPLAGLGASMNALRRLCVGSDEALDKIDQATQRPAHRPVGSVDNVNTSRPAGNGATQALRRLRKDRPDLHAEVLAGNLSAHAAMVDAGYRPRTISIRLDDPERAARSLIRNAKPEFIAALREALEVAV